MILRRPISRCVPWPGRPRTWKRFDLFKAALDILKDRGLEASDVVWCVRVWSSVGRMEVVVPSRTARPRAELRTLPVRPDRIIYSTHRDTELNLSNRPEAAAGSARASRARDSSPGRAAGRGAAAARSRRGASVAVGLRSCAENFLPTFAHSDLAIIKTPASMSAIASTSTSR
jgi:hypothetical protein